MRAAGKALVSQREHGSPGKEQTGEEQTGKGQTDKEQAGMARADRWTGRAGCAAFGRKHAPQPSISASGFSRRFWANGS
ncbi:hypothetical protein JCM14124_19490 [Humidesulfovibrio idahonensis]